MKPLLSLTFLLFLLNSINGQFEFEPGYFVDNDGNRIDCFIKNMVWKNNPNQFQYKLDLTSEPKTAVQDEVQEFGIDGNAKYVKSKVIIDTYYTKLSGRSNELNFDYNEEELLLNVLEEGEATLYKYQSKHYERYLFSVRNGPIEQLVYKSFVSSEEHKGTKLEYGRKYKLQLYKKLACEEITPDVVASVKFKKRDLVAFFNKYNVCKTGTSRNYFNYKKKHLFNIRPRVGLGLVNSSGLYDDGREVEAFKNGLSIRLGVELEYYFSYLDGVFSFLFEPGLFVISKTSPNFINRGQGKLSYYAVHLPLGFRYSYKLSPDSRVYLNVLNDLEFATHSKIQYENNSYPVQIYNLKHLFLKDYSIGLGLQFNKKNVEIRYHANKKSKTSSVYKLQYNTTELILGYQF